MATRSLPLILLLGLGPQQVPEPELVQPGVISTDRNETFPSIDPVDGSLWFSVFSDSWNKHTMMRAPRQGSTWGTPAVVSWSGGEWSDRAPRFSPDGKRLYFASSRPTPPSTGGGHHLWMLERTGTTWSAPRPLPEPVNTASEDRHSSVTSAGDLYYSSTRPGGAGRSDLYRARSNGNAWTVDHLPAPINDSLGQTDVFVAPNGKWMIYIVTDHPQGLGGDDLFLSEFKNGEWSPPKHLPAPINSKEYEYGPSLSPDGRTLYFTSHRRGTADVYRIPVSALGITP
jgi:Tol biopolymer transport system component